MTSSRPAAFAGVILLAAMIAPALAAPACKAMSGASQTPLVELYSSEGCDSCPPADRWLAETFPAQAQGGAPIALAFHVDYWDRLGWKDRFATAEFTSRQYAEMRANGASFVYTPQVLLQGRDFPRWRNGDASGAISRAAISPPRAQIALAATPRGTDVVVHASVNVPDATARHAQLFVAYADSGLASQVTAGENRGVRLTHDHLVRMLHAPVPIKAPGELQTDVTFTYPKERGSAPQVVAFVQDGVSGEVLQALALSLASCANP